MSEVTKRPLKIFRCDACGTVWDEGSQGRLGDDAAWIRSRWIPGILTNTETRPDRHFCTSTCADTYQRKKEEKET